MRSELALLLLAGCSSTSLYARGDGDPPDDRLAMEGRVCTTDARSAGFPVRVVLMVDTAWGEMFTDFDPELRRIDALADAVSLHSGSGQFAWAIGAFGAFGRVIAPTDGSKFSRDPLDIELALEQLALPQGCVGDVCRDYTDALDVARSIIEGDLVGLSRGDRLRTQYQVVLVGGGPPEPLRGSWDDTTAELVSLADDLRGDVEGAGALSLGVHALFLGANEGDTDMESTADMLQQVSFVGGGAFEHFRSPDAVSLDRVGLLKLSQLLVARSLLVTNRSLLPGPGGGAEDSDLDGLHDEVEADLGTDPTTRDSDGDDLGDLVELLIARDPLEFTDAPATCVILDGPPYADTDGDGMNDCEERLVGTEASLADTDADGIPDWIEVTQRTNYLSSDLLEDDDFDGANNGAELLQHTDPAASDANTHLGSAYRYDVRADGVQLAPRVADVRRIPGVVTRSAGDATEAGTGLLTYTPGTPASLSWQGPLDAAPGSPVAVQDGLLTLQGQGLERWLRVEVQADLLPPDPVSEQLLVELSERSCLSWTVRNVALREGHNQVELWFSQAPEGRLDQPGLFRRAVIDVAYDPATGRTPAAPVVEVVDELFTATAQTVELAAP